MQTHKVEGTEGFAWTSLLRAEPRVGHENKNPQSPRRTGWGARHGRGALGKADFAPARQGAACRRGPRAPPGPTFHRRFGPGSTVPSSSATPARTPGPCCRADSYRAQPRGSE